MNKRLFPDSTYDLNNWTLNNLTSKITECNYFIKDIEYEIKKLNEKIKEERKRKANQKLRLKEFKLILEQFLEREKNKGDLNK